MEVLFPSLQEIFFGCFFWSRGPKLCPNRTGNTKFWKNLTRVRAYTRVRNPLLWTGLFGNIFATKRAVYALESFIPDGSKMTDYGPGWLTMAQDDIPGVRGPPGGPGGRQGAPGGWRLLPAPKRVIKQQYNGPKPWFKVPKVCPDPWGMVLTHFWGIWGHLVAFNQRYLMKTQICQ